MMIATLSLTVLTVLAAESTVLDPALYLAPSPPLVLTSGSIPPGAIWSQTLEDRVERVAREGTLKAANVYEKPESVETGRMFWPRYSAPQPALGINIPLTFSLSGSYGKSVPPTGVIGSSYTSITGLGHFGGLRSSLLGQTAVGSTASVYGAYGRSALAGSGYGTYGIAPRVRVYGGDTGVGWSGWGNGKWGHYGKG